MLSYEDRNGTTVQQGDIVEWGDLTYEVMLVEGPIPGSWATMSGLGTLYLRGEGGRYYVTTAASVTVVGEYRCSTCGTDDRTEHNPEVHAQEGAW